MAEHNRNSPATRFIVTPENTNPSYFFYCRSSLCLVSLCFSTAHISDQISEKSENYFERELNLSWRIGASNCPERSIREVRVRRAKVSAVKNVEKLRPELHLSSFSCWNRNGFL